MQEELAAILQPSGLALPALGCLDVAAGCVLLEQDHLEEAEQRLRQGLDRMGWGMNPYYLMTAYLALFRLYEIQGRLAEAAACLDQLDALWPDIQLITQGYRVQAELRIHRDNPGAGKGKGLDPALPFFSGRRLPAAGLGPIGAAEAYYQANFIWARLQIGLGRTSRAQSMDRDLDFQLQRAHENGLRGREIELTLLQAQMVSQARQ